MGAITREFANNVTLTKGSGLAKISSASSDTAVAKLILHYQLIINGLHW